MAYGETFGAVLTAYHNHVASWSGYNANNQLNDDKYMPSPRSHKGFYIEFTENNDTGQSRVSGKTEIALLRFELKVLFYYERSSTLSANEAETWTAIDAAKKALYTFASGRGDIIYFSNIDKMNIEGQPDYKLVRFSGTISFQWSMTA